MNQSGFKYFFFSIICFICFCGCSKKSVCYSGTADEIMNIYNEKENFNFKDGDIFEIEGIIEYIFYPKDGFKINECGVYLGTKGCNIEKFEGNYISCKFNHRLDKCLVGKKVRVKGAYKRIYESKTGTTIKLVKCEIIDTDNLD